jgi:two-component system, NtrC family, sensor histidine kinase AtoS
MNSPSPFSHLSLRKRFRPVQVHIEALLDLLPQAAFLVDQNHERTILVNSKALELSAYTQDEITGAPLSLLFPEFDRTRFNEQGAEPFQTALAKRRGQMIDVQLICKRLDPSGDWNLLLVEQASEAARREMELVRESCFLEAIRNLVLSFQESSAQSALDMAVKAGSHLTGAGLVAIYQAEGSDFSLTRSAVFGPAELLPEQINPQDLVTLQAPTYWSRKKRPLSALHRAARASNLAFVASAPLGQTNALVGLLIAAGEQENGTEDTLTLIQTMAVAVTSLIQTQAQAEHLTQQIKSQATTAAAGEAIHTACTEGMISLSTELEITEINPAAETILGYASREVIGLPYQHVFVGVENLIPPFVTGESLVSTHNLGNIRLYRRNGQTFLANVRTVPVIVDDKMVRMIVLIEDLSQEEQYRIHNQQLEQRALIGEVSAIFAHEVRNPINNISTGLQLLSYNLAEDDPHQEVLQKLQQDCDRLEVLMKSTLAFSRPREYKMEPVDLAETIPRLLERWSPHLARVNIKLVTQIEGNTPSILGDVRALEQVWNNLVGNAVQAMGQEGGVLVVKVRPIHSGGTPNRVEVIISDTGPGIPEEIRERIFELFYTTHVGGTGLGLPITKRIIAAHRGSIQLTSVPGGTSFQVQLPVPSS